MVGVAQLFVFAIGLLVGTFREDKLAAIMVAKQVSPDQHDVSLALGSLVPKNNFYRRLKQVLDLDFLFAVVAP